MFYDTRYFPFVETLERNWKTIRREVEQVSQDAFQTYRNFTPWKVFIFRKGFDPQNIEHYPDNRNRCPETSAILDSIPGVTSAAFSRLLPGTHLWPHRCNNTRVRCHLGLIVVDGCAINVGGMVQGWEEGKCMIFNARYLHEAWNRNTLPRTVLLVDVSPDVLEAPPEKFALPKTPLQNASAMWLKTRYVARKNLDRLRAATGRPVVADHAH
ncbi:MAG TPA: aspartyl/asparaginyl beta-hydroxylase domain-containing protein [Candidatus Binatia bacterium]|nr:aspartyl/asparaginyl beta-hydroxylase domain-containing protein [Candidatus Binatia bacterium]